VFFSKFDTLDNELKTESLMKCHRVDELIELMHPEWQKDSDLSLMQFIIKLSKEAGYKDAIEKLTDDVLIYHLKMRNSPKDEMIPGLAKDQVDDFKTALLKARGIIE
jgi:uncharacterized protein YihD (DUF1040 family)